MEIIQSQQETPPTPPDRNLGRSFRDARTVVFGAALVLTLTVAFALRLYGIDWDEGYGYSPHPDERFLISLVDSLAFPSLGNIDELLDPEKSPWNPGRFAYGSFSPYLLKLSRELFRVTDDIRLIGRGVSALADVASVFLVYLLGARMYGRRVGLLAAVFLTLAVIHIQLSHFLTVDIILGLTTIAALYFMHRVATEGNQRDSLIAGVIVGLGMATKVSQAPIYLALVMAHLLYIVPALRSANDQHSDLSQRVIAAITGLLAAVGASIATFLIVQPYAIIDWSQFVSDVSEQSEMVRRIRDYPYTRQYIDTAAYSYHVRQMAAFGLGWPLGVVAWAGLLYAGLRGMRLHHGLIYLAVGWLIPVAVLAVSTSLIAIVMATIIAFAAIVATLPVRSPESRGTALLLSWVVPYFLIIGVFQVKFIRYLIPITPLLIILGSHMLFQLWDKAASYRRWLRHVVTGAIAALAAVTGLYAAGYMSVYSEPHTAVRMSEWIASNVPQGSIILREHWEESLPGLEKYDVRELPLYEDDRPYKLDNLAAELSEADYIVFFSNRLYGTIPRLPDRYPFTSGYYKALFGGDLGYELANVETAYPRIAEVALVDDTYGRPGLPRPAGLETPAELRVDLGYADESFSVYDHPKVLVFENVERLDAGSVRARIMSASDASAFSPDETSEAREMHIGLILSPEDLRSQRAGGTWTDIVDPDGLASRMPVLAWLLAMRLMGLAALPLALALFRSLPDGGYLLAKPLGILLAVLVAWMLSSFQWMAFSFGAVIVGVVVVASISIVVMAFTWRAFLQFVRERWRVIVVCETVFIAAFLAFVLLRMANPDLWHPWQGGEKPMDTAYLNAVLKSTSMPPYDPWYAGGYINYYYWGQFIVASFVHLTGIDTAIAVNLAVPMFFALTVGCAFCIVYNLAERARERLSERPGRADRNENELRGPVDQVSSPPDEAARGLGDAPVGLRSDSPRAASRAGLAWSPVLAGVAGALFVAVLGNMDGIFQVGAGALRTLVGYEPFGVFDFWRSSRMMPPDPPGNEITEFPFFTFLFADLHAHLMAIPFTLLVIGVLLSALYSAAGRRSEGGTMARWGWGLSDVAHVAVLGIAVGALRLINTWDYPTGLLLCAAALLLAGVIRNGGLNFMVIAEAVAKSVAIFLIGFIVFLPYHLDYEVPFSGIEATTNQTVLWQFLAISGLFVFVIASYSIADARQWLSPIGRALWRPVSAFVSAGEPDGEFDRDQPRSRRVRAIRLTVALLGIGFVALVVVLNIVEITGSTTPFILVLGILCAAAGMGAIRAPRADAPQTAFTVLLALAAFGIVIGVDIYRVEGDIDRMNTVFKFYLQVWSLLALAAAYFLWRLAHGRTLSIQTLSPRKKVWLGILAALVLCASIYPVLGTRERLRSRFDTTLPLTLDGMAYMKDGRQYSDQNGVIDLTADYEAIRWIQQNIQGSPVMLEGVTPTYRWGGRVSIYTGLPTVAGWEWHQQQQRWNYRDTVPQRIAQVARIYNTPDAREALGIMREYGVEFIYLGQVERLYYERAGLAKFDTAFDGALEQVYDNRGVRIFRLRR